MDLYPYIPTFSKILATSTGSGSPLKGLRPYNLQKYLQRLWAHHSLLDGLNPYNFAK